jgi:hypothetical protein
VLQIGDLALKVSLNLNNEFAKLFIVLLDRKELNLLLAFSKSLSEFLLHCLRVFA